MSLEIHNNGSVVCTRSSIRIGPRPLYLTVSIYNNNNNKMFYKQYLISDNIERSVSIYFPQYKRPVPNTAVTIEIQYRFLAGWGSAIKSRFKNKKKSKYLANALLSRTCLLTQENKYGGQAGACNWQITDYDNHLPPLPSPPSSQWSQLWIIDELHDKS